MPSPTPVYVTAKLQAEPSTWELVLRYVAATAATLLAIAGAQLVVPNQIIVVITIATLIGVPVSLYLRLTDMKLGGYHVPRLLLNGITVVGTFVTATYYIFWSMREMLIPLLNGGSAQLFFIRFGAGELVGLLMQVFLLFAAFRSFALISDKDATLTTVPSFSVLLLLIPVHKGVEVVFYFLAWTVVATILFALDHRSEIRSTALAYVPSTSPGQDVRMAGRSLGTILMVSMIAAVGISYYLTSRDPQQRSAAETAISSLATRITNMALSLPETSVNSGPERQIDFASNPTTLTRSALWRVQAFTYGGKPIRPEYWRLFSLDRYNGAVWSQSNIVGGRTTTTRVPVTDLTDDRWPDQRLFRQQVQVQTEPSIFERRRGDDRGEGRGDGFRLRPPPRDFRVTGFDISTRAPKISEQFGPSAGIVRQNVTAVVPNIGYLPVAPAVQVLTIRGSEQKEVRLQKDGAIDLGVVESQQTVRVLSEIPGLPEYGMIRGDIPTQQLTAAEIERSGIKLSAAERRVALLLPPRLPARVKALAKQMLVGSEANESNLRRAQRLALEIQQGSVYTLRPPSVPADRDAADYFLFEGNRRGYCTYFAGALAVLCRTQGIPARVVSGFVNPEWEASSGSGLLLEANAHAWTEVWVEGWGWAIVDATPADDRGDNAPTWFESWTDFFSSSTAGVVEWVRGKMVYLGLLSLIGIAFILQRFRKHKFGFSLRLNLRYDEDSERRAVVEIYRAMARQIARQFRQPAKWETPDEWLQPYAATLDVPEAEALRRLTSLYLMALYRGKPLPQGSARLARDSATYLRRSKKKSQRVVEA
ncbi:hypothetical protein EON80_02695 [bacterium]|nr:MAG: hypothetical protein EON80_02695 [bacterium]